MIINQASTEKLYYKDQYLKNVEVKLIDIMEVENTYFLVFDRTIFFPQGGGQSSDIGKVHIGSLTLNIDHVSQLDESKIILHRVKDPLSKEEKNTLRTLINTSCQMEIDWSHRFDNMQRHLGEHILSGAFYNLYNGLNKGFHMGEDYITIDILFEDNRKLTWEMIEKVELKANMAIWQDLPVRMDFFQNWQEAQVLPMRKAVSLDDEISVVTVGDLSSPADCCPCCGTHPSSAGQVGMIKIYKFEPNKNMWRIYLEAGHRAFKKYQHDHLVLDTICRDNSASTEDLLDKYRAKSEKQQRVRDRLHSAIGSLSRLVGKDIEEYLSSEEYLNGHLTSAFHFVTLQDSEITKLGNRYAQKAPFPLICIDDNSKTAFLFSDGQRDVGQFVKDKAKDFNGKGGGTSTMARAIFTSDDDMHQFLTTMNEYFNY